MSIFELIFIHGTPFIAIFNITKVKIFANLIFNI